MKDKILYILKKVDELYSNKRYELPEKRQKIAAKEIAKLFAESTKDMYEREFVEWLVTNEKFLIEIDRDLDYNLLAWGFGDYESEDIKRYTLDEVHNYWKQNIKGK